MLGNRIAILTKNELPGLIAQLAFLLLITLREAK